MLSVTGEYALRAMVYLARNSESWPISGPRIAEAAGVPRKYLSSILADLVRSGLLEGTRGKSGGFHSLGEWIDLTDAWQGAQSSLVTVLGLVGVQGVSEPLLAKRR